MSQIFKPSINKIANYILTVFCLLLFSIAIFSYGYFHSSFFYNVGAFHEQPISFNHNLHVQGLGLDCRFCHSSVEKSKTAGMPSTEDCMSCHSQILTNKEAIRPLVKSLNENHPIEWARVNILADHVFFDHSIHVNKGVSCVTCHGDVDQMIQSTKVKPLTMNWCLECHSHPENQIVSANQVFTTERIENKKMDMTMKKDLMKKYRIDKTRLKNCYECHR
ncbi:MAG: cytochrome c3 family protein [Bacteriovorax sp.]